MVIQGSPLLILSGLSAFVVGFLYGTVFGNVEWFRMITGLPGPLWFEPFTNIRLMLRLSITIGVIHIISGLVLDITNKLYVQEYQRANIRTVGVALVLRRLWHNLASIWSQSFPTTFSTHETLPDLFLRIGVPLIAMILLKLWAEGGMGLMHAFENLLASLSHTISYVRILAMKLIDDVFCASSWGF